ncbi:hypothetical protein A9Q77_03335 [Marinomonas sp. 42_23_T18]|nr:hypothetical protein A9Q77_03335 [Marinomonas sp. 42_23_T18]
MHSLKVLIADEFQNSRQSIKKILASLDINKVSVTSNGKGVIDACRNTAFDLILCNYNLGKGKNGLQVLEEIRKLGYLKATSSFIFISAETSRDVIMSLMETKPDEFLTKPFNQSELIKRVKHLFNKNNELINIKSAIEKEDHGLVVALCQTQIENGSHYKSWCQKKLAEALLESCRYKDVLDYCFNLQQSKNLDWAMLIEAKALKEQGSTESAINHLNKLVSIFHNNTPAYDLLARYYKQIGLTQMAQTSLEAAVRISPYVITRQQFLVDLSLSNGDLTTALKSGQQTLKLSKNSIYASENQHLQLAQVLAESIIGDTTPEARKKAQDAFTILSQINKKFPDKDETQLQRRLVECQVFNSQGKLDQARDALVKAQELIEKQPDLLSPKIEFEFAKTLFITGNSTEANTLFQKIIEENPKNYILIAKIHAFIDEPIGVKARLKAKEENQKGLDFFEKTMYSEAIECLVQAQRLSPSHPGLNMNIIQTALKVMRDSGPTHFLVDLSFNALHRINHITEKHCQYKRYLSLKKYLEKHYLN